ncbi:hypothetical protein LCGC14_1954030, partial [marine sediment metagenome]
MIKKRKLGVIIGFLIIFQFLFIPNFFPLFGRATIQVEDEFPETSDLIYLGVPYMYQGTFYDDTDATFSFTTGIAKIEFVYDPTAYDPLVYEFDVSEDFTNVET